MHKILRGFENLIDKYYIPPTNYNYSIIIIIKHASRRQKKKRRRKEKTKEYHRLPTQEKKNGDVLSSSTLVSNVSS